MNRSNLKFFSSTIATAALSRKTALQCEVAVCFAVHIDSNEAKRLTRAALCEVFTQAGYKAAAPGALDWKSVNRRITAALALYDFFGTEDIAKWVEGKSKGDLIDAIVKHLEPLKLKSTNEILEVCGKTGPAAQRARREQMGAKRIETKHLKLTIPPTATRAEILEVAVGLMRIAEEMASEMLGDAGTATAKDAINAARERAAAAELAEHA